jgi:site-specific DNA-cytosine methylase
MLQRTSTARVFRVAHMFCGIGAGAKGFNDAHPRVGHLSARFECAGGIDIDAGAIRNFERITGTRGTVMDLFDVEQYTAFHGHPPAPGFVEATPADISRTFGHDLDCMFLSAPCKGFSGLLSTAASVTPKYQALNRLTLRGVWLTLEAYKNNPIPVILFENVVRIATRGRHLLDQIVALLRAYGYVVTESAHDCGEIGDGLAQSRKRFLLVARHAAKVPPFLYQPRKSRLRGVGEVIGQLPLPGDPAAGIMHRVPQLQWKTWIRLAFVPAGKDWRALNELAIEDGHLRDFGIVPELMRDNQLGVCGWGDTAPTITGQRSPAQGRFSVADPRIETTREGSGRLGVRDWSRPSGLVAGASRPDNGAYSVADPRPTQANQTYGQYGVNDWTDTTGAVTAQAAPGGGPNSIADPRLGRVAHSNVYRVTSFDQPAAAITSSREMAVADPRPTHGTGAHHNKMRVVSTTGAAPTITGSDRVGSGALSVADPRPVCLNAEGRTGYATQGHYGVLDWSQPSGAVPGYAKYDRGNWSIADPRDIAPAPIATLPAPGDRLVARIVALDGTWHRPFTTLELAALQSLFDPGEVFDLDAPSDQLKREWIGNAVPSSAARGMAETIGETLLLAAMGETFVLSSREIWTKPLALALAVDPRQPTDGIDA